MKNYLFKPHGCCCFQAVDGPQHIGVSGYVLNQLNCQMIQSEVEMTDYGLSVERGLNTRTMRYLCVEVRQPPDRSVSRRYVTDTK